MNLEHVFFTLLLIISYKVMRNFSLGTSPPNVFISVNDTYPFVQSD